MISISLPADMEERLTALALATQRPKSFYIQEALERSLEDIEDAYLADAAYERFKSSKCDTIPLEDVMREYGMES